MRPLADSWTDCSNKGGNSHLSAMHCCPGEGRTDAAPQPPVGRPHAWHSDRLVTTRLVWRRLRPTVTPGHCYCSTTPIASRAARAAAPLGATIGRLAISCGWRTRLAGTSPQDAALAAPCCLICPAVSAAASGAALLMYRACGSLCCPVLLCVACWAGASERRPCHSR